MPQTRHVAGDVIKTTIGIHLIRSVLLGHDLPLAAMSSGPLMRIREWGDIPGSLE